jgi:hypothetical protein
MNVDGFGTRNDGLEDMDLTVPPHSAMRKKLRNEGTLLKGTQHSHANVCTYFPH